MAAVVCRRELSRRSVFVDIEDRRERDRAACPDAPAERATC
jgi:hypothetical protein